MIECPGMFRFAAPPMTGAGWFLDVLGSTNIPCLGDGSNAHVPFVGESDGHLLQLSLVRNPACWLALCHLTLRGHSPDASVDGLDEFVGLDTRSLESFFHDYLTRRAGAITRLFNVYVADTVIRIEDMPYALLELMWSLNVPRTMLQDIVFPNLPVQPVVQPWLHEQLRYTDGELFERYDYW